MITAIRVTGRTDADFLQAEFAAYIWAATGNRTDPDLGVRQLRMTTVGRRGSRCRRRRKAFGRPPRLFDLRRGIAALNIRHFRQKEIRPCL